MDTDVAAEAYIRDIAQCLRSGVLSDLTLKFRDRAWKIHKALACCHSKWFQKALTGGFKEATSGVITLADDDQFMDAIDCMITYFYKAGYDDGKYDKSIALLHAQIAVIADKYDCESLFSLAKMSFAEGVKDVDSEEWVVVASLIYNHTTKKLQVHKDLRSLVISSISERPVAWEQVLRLETMIELLLSNKDLAIDLLLEGSITLREYYRGIYHIKCDECSNTCSLELE